MNGVIGLIGALVAAIFFGSQFATLRIAKKKPSSAQYQLMTAFGIILLSTILVPILKLRYAVNIAGIVGGFFWAAGNFLATKAVEKSGLSRTMPIWSGCIIIISFVIGLFVFSEIIRNVYMGISGTLAIILGIFFVSKGYGKMKEKSDKMGIIFAVLAGAFFSFPLVPMKIAHLTSTEFFFPMSIGILITATMIFLLHRERINNVAILNGLAGGAIWNVGNLGAIFSVTYLGLAVGYPLTQMAAVVAVLWGIFVFKEIRESTKKTYVLLGAITVILGAVLLASAK